MATTTPAQFLTYYPEFVGIASDSATREALVERELDFADDWLSTSAFDTDTRRNRALELVTAHRLALKYQASVAVLQSRCHPGVTTSEGLNTGGVSFSYKPVKGADSDATTKADFARTDYGVEYLTLVSQAVSPAELSGQEDN